ncbi:Coq4 family protein [Gloeothece verrucosa]|uniref:Coenzyme Q biosynthesis Coq4 n=1 Tax=Gloeothece verrucosa (strain PCC 7822) TaxID=497965 RepID=E0ULE8_GLOV7|nr:Coq4 family protein [Gloeothece verrucosa]ADN17778.1 Coenzyme Q biosynthesis Coq4 [Gloeothece verrucosa PCC 7822]
MAYRYINQLATPENINRFLEFVDLAAGSGQDTTNVWEIERRLVDSRPMQLCVKAVLAESSSAQLVKERYIGPAYDLEAMGKMPKDSLGWTYSKIMTALGYDPQFYPQRTDFESDADYIGFRVNKTHDIHHILTGFSLDGLGELGVISITVAQTRYPTFLLIDLLALLMTFFTSDTLLSEVENDGDLGKTLGYKFDLISQGITIGRNAKPLFPIKWEEGFERSLEEWREELNIKPVLEGPWSWYSRPELRAAIA